MKKSAFSVLLTGILLLFFISSGFCETTIEDVINNATHAAESATDIQSKKIFYALQVGAFLKENTAEQKVIELKKAGYEPYIFQSVNSKNQTIYAVRIGKYKDYQTAAASLSNIQADLNLPAFIAHYDSLETALPSKTSASPGLAVAENRKPPEAVRAAPPVEAEAPRYEPDQIEGPATLETLQKKIKSLESSIKQLSEEAEVRKKLQMSEQEKSEQEQEEDILEAAGKEYTLTTAGNIKFSYGLGYSYSEFDAIKESVRIEEVANHSISNSFHVSYGVKNNLSLGAGIPFVYKYDKVGTIDSKDVTGLGDLSLSWSFQPVKTSSDLPTIILNGSFSVPVGKSPYDILVGEELSTGSGIYSTGLGVSISQVSDPVVVFSSLSLSYPFKTTNINQKRTEGILMEVDPGMGLGISAGLGYALSYKLNLNASFGYSYSFETKYAYKDAPSAKSGTAASANLNLGVGYKFRRNQNLNFSIGIPITSSRQFSFSFSTPIEFEL